MKRRRKDPVIGGAYGDGASDMDGNYIPESMMPVVNYVFNRWSLIDTHSKAKVGVFLMKQGITAVPDTDEAQARLRSVIASLTAETR